MKKLLDNRRFSKCFVEDSQIGQDKISYRHKLDKQLYSIQKIPILIGASQDLLEHPLFKQISKLGSISSDLFAMQNAFWAEKTPKSMVSPISFAKDTT
jgi:hypothetical protein